MLYPQGTDGQAVCSWTRESGGGLSDPEIMRSRWGGAHLGLTSRSDGVLRSERHPRSPGRHVRCLLRRRGEFALLRRLGIRLGVPDRTRLPKPLADSPTLYRFLQENNQTATHFFIGSNMLANPDIFAQALASGGHIGVHTFSHPYVSLDASSSSP